MTVERYDLSTIDFSVQGWDALFNNDVSMLQDLMVTREVVTLGETVIAYDVLYQDASDSKWYKALSDGSKQPCQGIAIEGGDEDDEIRIHRMGKLTNAGGVEKITWTAAGWDEDAHQWTVAGTPVVITHVADTGHTTALTSTLASTIIAGKTYKIVITYTQVVGTCSYTLGGVSGSSIATSAISTSITDYITATTTAQMIITPLATSNIVISSISIQEVWNWGMIGVPIYLDGSNAGVLTQTPPATNAQIVGFAMSATSMIVVIGIISPIISRGGTILSPTGAMDVIVWEAPFACTVKAIKGYRVGGTGATINARLNGSSNHLASALSLTSADTWMDGGSVQNTAYAAGDKLEIMIVSVAGSPTQIGIQIDLVRK